MTNRWTWSGPEEGDGDDTIVIMFDGDEVITIPHDGDVEAAKDKARAVCAVLNANGVQTL